MQQLIAIIAIVVLIVIVFARNHLRRMRAHDAPPPLIPAQPDDGRPRIRDLTIEDIRSGRNWKVRNPDEMLAPHNLEDLHISLVDDFSEDDHVVYSAVFVTKDGSVSPLVLIKEVGDADYGGDYCEVHAGKWRQVGLVPNPAAPQGAEYIANPLDNDPSFVSEPPDEYRNTHRAGFRKWSEKLTRRTT